MNTRALQPTSQHALGAKLPPLRQRNPLGSPISVSLQKKGATVPEDCRATEAYGAPPRRPLNRDLTGLQRSPQHIVAGIRGAHDSLTEAGGSSRNTGPTAQSRD